MGKNPIKTKRQAARKASKERKKRGFTSYWKATNPEQSSHSSRKKKPKIRLMEFPKQ